MTVHNVNRARAGFTAPTVTARTTLTFKLTVTAGSKTSTDTMNVVVTPPAFRVEAGTDQTVASGASVELSGSATGSSGTKSYTWRQTGGSPTVTISDADQASASFTAPTVAARTTLTFKLTVTGEGSTVTDTVQVTVLGPPKVTDVTFTSRPMANSTYKLGERIRSRVAFDGIVVVSGSPILTLGVGSRTRSMTHIGLDRGRVLDFEYQVQASDVDTNGVSIGTNALSIPTGASITSSRGDAAALGLSGHAITNDPARKVDGSQGSTLPVGGTLPACTATDP